VSVVKWINGRPLVLPSLHWELDIEDTARLMMRGDKKKWLRRWAWTERGRDLVSDLIDRGYRLDVPMPISGGARNFDAVDDRLDRSGDDATLDVADGDSLVIQTLAKLDAVGTVGRVLCGKENNINALGSAGYQIAMRSTEVPTFHVADAVDEIEQQGTALVAGTWYALTGVLVANSLTNDDGYLYQNSTVNGPTNSALLGSLENDRPFRVGAASEATPGNFWDGDIAYVRFWKKAAAAWTANERLQRVEWLDQLYLPQDLYMELQWILWDAGTPTTAIDYTDNAFDGTYTGTTFVDDPKRVYMASDWPVNVEVEAAIAAAASLVTRPRISAGVITR